MTAAPLSPASTRPGAGSLFAADAEMARRRRSETRFRTYGVVAIAISLAVLALMLVTVFSDGIGAFRQA